LGKFEAKGDEGYFLRYSLSSKAFRIFNKRTKRVEENVHIEFLENKAVEKEPSSATRLISKRVTNQEEIPSLDNILTLTNQFEDILKDTSNSEESNGVKADVSYMETSITASHTPTLKIHKDHPKSQIISPVDTSIQTRNKSKEVRMTMDGKKTWWLRLGAGIYDSWKLQGDVEELWDELAKLEASMNM
nr:retrovirus-related Pol polyprotein from transposon TNT 1-94 [Tanacetum cinerariifolium]